MNSTEKQYKNLDVWAEKGAITFKEIAAECGYSRVTLHKWFNEQQMNSRQKAIVLKAIEDIKARKGGN